MKKLVGVLLALGSIQSAVADVTPADLALNHVRARLESYLENTAARELPPHMPAHYVVDYRFELGRGKYSQEEFGFMDFRGRAHFTFQIGSRPELHEVDCDVSGTVRKVPFAKQQFPILEEDTSVSQLILTREDVSCR